MKKVPLKYARIFQTAFHKDRHKWRRAVRLAELTNRQRKDIVKHWEDSYKAFSSSALERLFKVLADLVPENIEQ